MARGTVDLRSIVKKYGQPYSELLGIDLCSGRNQEAVKWFLASVLYSKPIRESSATKTYGRFLQQGVVTVDRIVETGWEGLVSLLDAGGYTRYDFSTADKLLEVFGNLKKNYRGDLNLLHRESRDARDLENRLKTLGKGIGSTTVSIFLRDMRQVWNKADPEPTPLVRMAMKKLKVRDLKALSRTKRIDLVRLETALLRLAKDFLRKKRALGVIV